MKFGKPANLSLILVGLNKVGIVGLRDAIRKANNAGLTEREETVDHIMQLLSNENYIPDPQDAEYRQTIWREFLRHRGENIRPFYSEIEVTVRGKAGPERDRFVQTLTSVLNEFELQPSITYLPPSDPDAALELMIDDESVVRGSVPQDQLKLAVHRRISEW
jgi:hypothetical protein